MQDLKVTLVQANQLWEDKQGNLENYESLLSGLETDLIVLPEMFQTGFSMNTGLAEEMDSSESIAWLKQIASSYNAAIYTSLMIRANNSVFNRGVFVEPNGTIHTYDKRKTFGLAKEDQYFEAGTSPSIVEYKGWRFQLQICYDLRFPEISRNEILPNQQANYDVLLYVANWPAKRSLHWQRLLAARAIENQSYVIGVNRVGKDAKELDYSGDSVLIDSLGNEQNLHKGREECISFTLNMNELSATREMLPFLKDAKN